MNKKIVSAMATMAIGALLIGGATFAYFNDTRAINNSFASGTLQFDVDKTEANHNYPVNFDLANLKPGDTIARNFDLVNTGSLSIKEVWMDVDASNYADANADADYLSFLDQFQVQLIKVVDPENPEDLDANTLINQSGQVLTLKDLYLAKNGGADLTSKIKAAYLDTTGRKINLAPSGLSADPSDRDRVRVNIQFLNKNVPQNQFQGDAIKVKFNLEATQYAGSTVQHSDSNGTVTGNAYVPGTANHPVINPAGKVITTPVTDN